MKMRANGLPSSGVLHGERMMNTLPVNYTYRISSPFDAFWSPSTQLSSLSEQYLKHLFGLILRQITIGCHAVRRVVRLGEPQRDG